jgi:toxin secretion/phage lysis holin
LSIAQIKTAIFAFGYLLSYFIGGWDKGIELLLTAAIIDYISGIAATVYESGFRGLNYRRGYQGIIKKVGLFAAVAVAVFVERSIGQPNSIHEAVAFGFTLNEAFSILKNLKRLGINVTNLKNTISTISKRKGR